MSLFSIQKLFIYFSLSVLMTSGLFGVADGKWHDIQIKWMKDEVWLNIDYGQYEITQQSFNSVGGKVVTKVMVGDSSDEENHLQGCVRVSIPFSVFWKTKSELLEIFNTAYFTIVILT